MAQMSSWKMENQCKINKMKDKKMEKCIIVCCTEWCEGKITVYILGQY